MKNRLNALEFFEIPGQGNSKRMREERGSNLEGSSTDCITIV